MRRPIRVDKQRKVILGAVVAIIVVVVGLWGMPTSGYLTPSDVVKGDLVGEKGEVKGTVVAGTLHVGDDATYFDLTDGTNTITVKYVGALAPDLAEGKEVVAVGTLTSPDQVDAHKILVGCTSKYGS